jgi:hypothetical protein
MSISSANTVGAGRAFGRTEADFYPTPPECTLALLEHWTPPSGPIWEPACGDGAISRVLADAGLRPFSSDLHYRGFGEWIGDFLNDPPRFSFCSVITNPPFNLAEKFIRRAAGFQVPFAMLLKSTYWHAATRAKLFEETRPEMVIAMTWRPSFDLRRGTSPTMDVIWTVWGAQPSDAPTIYVLATKPDLGAFG